MLRNITIALLLLLTCTMAGAQQTPSGNQGLSLQDLLGGLNLNEIFETLDEELGQSRELLEGVLGPALVDSAMNMIQQQDFQLQFDAIFQQMNQFFMDESGMGGMLDQLFQQLNGPLQNMPLPGMTQPPVKPDELDKGEWEIIPNVPQTPSKPAEKKQL